MSGIAVLRLSDAGLDFWVDLRVRRTDRGWLAVADLAGTPEVGVSKDLGLAILFAMWPLGREIATRLAGDMALMASWPVEP